MTVRETSPSGVDVCASRRHLLQELSSMPVSSLTRGDASTKSGVCAVTSVCAGVNRRSGTVTSCRIVPCSSHFILSSVFFNGAQDSSSKCCSDCDTSLLRRSVGIVKKKLQGMCPSALSLFMCIPSFLRICHHC